MRKLIPGIVIQDEFLSTVDFSKMRKFINNCTFASAKPGVSIWQANQENPQEARKIILQSTFAKKKNLKFKGVKVVGSESGVLSKFFKQVTSCAVKASLISAKDDNWGGVLAIPYLYQAGSKAVWHTDSGPYYGAFVYYLHEYWDRNWGGELLAEGESPSTGVFVEPRPNRIVFIRAGTSHMVTRLSDAAKGNRLSIAGFFFKLNGLLSMAKIEGISVGAAQSRAVKPRLNIQPKNRKTS